MAIYELRPLTPEEERVLGPRYYGDPFPKNPFYDFKLPEGVTHDHDHPLAGCPACEFVKEFERTLAKKK